MSDIQINIKKSSEKISSQLQSVFGLQKQIVNCVHDNKVIFDFSNIYFIQPTFITMFTSLCILLKYKNIEYQFLNVHSNINDYLNWMYFTQMGLKPDAIDDWERVLNRYNNKNYLPILNFPAHPSYSAFKDKAISIFSQQLYTNLGLKGKIQTPADFGRASIRGC